MAIGIPDLTVSATTSEKKKKICSEKFAFLFYYYSSHTVSCSFKIDRQRKKDLFDLPVSLAICI